MRIIKIVKIYTLMLSLFISSNSLGSASRRYTSKDESIVSYQLLDKLPKVPSYLARNREWKPLKGEDPPADALFILEKGEGGKLAFKKNTKLRLPRDVDYFLIINEMLGDGVPMFSKDSLDSISFPPKLCLALTFLETRSQCPREVSRRVPGLLFQESYC